MNVGDGFSANPQDVVAGLPGGKAYVTRYGRNPAKPEEGSDLLVIDPPGRRRRGRIALPAPAPAAPPGQDRLAPPTRAPCAIAGKLYVALNNLSDDFEAAAPAGWR